MKYRIVKYTEATGEVTYGIEQRRLGFLWWSGNIYRPGRHDVFYNYSCDTEEEAMKVIRSLAPRKKEVVKEVEG